MELKEEEQRKVNSLEQMTSLSTSPSSMSDPLRRVCTWDLSYHKLSTVITPSQFLSLNKTSTKPSSSTKQRIPKAMYGHSNINANEIPYVYSSSSSEYLGHFPSSSVVPAPLAIPVNDYDSLCALKSELNCSSSSGCSSYSSPTSLTSYGTSNTYFSSPTSLTSYEANNPNLMQRSISSHSLLHKNVEGFPALVSSPNGYYESETSPVRKVFSTGDLEGMNPKQQSHRSESSLANEYSIIESMSKACRYSPEEKKERIERYRSKRNLRNFNKKIKYECRKTLADSRPRIRGRFARNDEIEKISDNQWNHVGVEEDDEDDDSWINIIDSFSASLIP